jgi:hypothetical protein
MFMGIFSLDIWVFGFQDLSSPLYLEAHEFLLRVGVSLADSSPCTVLDLIAASYV